VFQGEVEAALARVALAAGAAPELVVDPAGLVPLGAEHVEAAEVDDLLALRLALRLEPLEQLVPALDVLLFRLPRFPEQLLGGETLGVAAEDDVDAPAGHVGRHRARADAAGLGDDHGLLLVLLGVEDAV